MGGKVIFQEKQNKRLSLSQMTLSHELRAPLSSILMILETVLQNLAKEALRETICVVISQVNLLLCLVTDMLDLKLLEQGKFVARKETFKIADVFHFVFKIFEFQAKLQASTIVFETKGSTPLPDSLIGDQIHLKQVLVNLIKNALKFSQRQEIKIQAKYEAREQLLHVAVIDKGRGIKADEMANLFTFFGKI